MAETAKAAPATLGTARIAGRIDSIRRISAQAGPLFLTLLKLPAASQYEAPATVEVQSGERLGQQGDEVSILVKVGGRADSYQKTDDDGQKVTIRTARNTLQYVAHA